MEAPREEDKTPPVDADRSPVTAAQTLRLIALGFGRFRVMSEHEHRLEWEREYRSHP